MADTFEALARDEQALKAFIAKSPSTLDVGTESFRVQRPFLDDLTAFSKDFSGADARAARRAAAGQPRGRDRHAGAGAPVKLNDEVRKTLGTRQGPRRGARRPTPRCAA